MAFENISTMGLIGRANRLEIHDYSMANDPEYALDVLNGDRPDPRGNENMDPDHPWNSISEIDKELAKRW